MSVSSAPLRLVMLAALALPGLAQAQIRTSDPSSPDVAAAAARGNEWQPVDAGPPQDAPAEQPAPPPQTYPAPTQQQQQQQQQQAPASGTGVADGGCGQPGKATFQNEDIFGAAERVFGSGTQGVAKFVQDILKKQGCPTAYIAGREAGGAIGIGLRYGQGDLYHKVEGQQPIYWTGPSLGFDIGGAGSKVLILVYNLYDSEEMFERFPLVEGNLYAVGGFTASYLRRGDVALVPIRLGVGWRFGASVGYMNFTHKGKVLPF